MMATTSYHFCIPANPTIKAMRMHADINLKKIRTCRNIAGMKRQLDSYSAPTDATSGMPVISAGGQLQLPGISGFRPTQYRYQVLIERARQLVQIAAQIEASLLNALEKMDNEAYVLQRAKQDLKIATAAVQLQNLRLTQANNSVKLAELQRDRANIELEKYQEWILAGLNQWELMMIDYYKEAGKFEKNALEFDIQAQIASAATTAAAGGATGGAAAAATAGLVAASLIAALPLKRSAIDARTGAQTSAVYASFERNVDQWELQRDLANQDLAIGNQQVVIANDTVNISKQEIAIAELQTINLRDTIEFLSTKFTNIRLYSWMSEVLEKAYRYFLQQATSIAKLASNQLAFLRQEAPPGYILDDYWSDPASGALAAAEETTDRKGITGSVRLLQDIYKLDQYAFLTNKRKLQLKKSISLSRYDPIAFQDFRHTGILNFTTPMELFDRDFPGQYLRLINKVSVSVIALIPPVQGIQATLSNSGLSRVMIGPNVFQTIPIRREPELIALTSPINATGLFEMEVQATEMLFPFEGTGVDTTWQFKMLKPANLLDYRYIADLVFTMEYSSLFNQDYYQQTIQNLPSRISRECAFSFSLHLSDQWHDFHNPDQTETPMTVRFKTSLNDLIPNISHIRIQHLELNFLCKEPSLEIPEVTLAFNEDENGNRVGGTALPMDGKVSTRRTNGSSWVPIIGKTADGTWELSLSNTEYVRTLFSDEKIEDILFVISYSGLLPGWPS